MELSIASVFWILLGCSYLVKGHYSGGVELMYFWSRVKYDNLPLDENSYIGNYQYYIPSNNDVLGVEYHARSRLVLATVGRLRPGVPSTLNAFCLDDYAKGTSPLLWGFPDYDKNTLRASFYGNEHYDIRELDRSNKYSSPEYYGHIYNSHRHKPSAYYDYPEDFSIISTYRPIVDDKCNRLFLLDTGLLHYSSSEIYTVQNPAFIVFELPTNGCETRTFPVIRRVEIPRSVCKDPLGLIYVTPDYQSRGTCDDVFLYITSAFESTLIVHDYRRGTFWSFTDFSMRPVMSQSDLIFQPNFPYEFSLGIMNLALGYPDKDGNRNAYFAPGASIGEYIVSTKLLKNHKHGAKFSRSDFTLIGFRPCDSQSMRQIIDLTTGVIFFAEMQSRKLRCWNTRLPLSPDNVGVVFESDDLQFVSEISLSLDGYIWFHSCHLPIVFLSDMPLSKKEVNSRTFRVKASEAIRGTVCDISNSPRELTSSHESDDD